MSLACFCMSAGQSLFVCEKSENVKKLDKNEVLQQGTVCKCTHRSIVHVCPTKLDYIMDILHKNRELSFCCAGSAYGI